MEKIVTQPKMSKLNLNCMLFEINLSTKNNTYRARCASLSKISQVKSIRPEASSKTSFDNAVQNLIPKIESALEGTDKRLGKVFTNDEGKLMFSVDDIIYENTKEIPQTIPSQLAGHTDTLNTMVSLFNNILINISSITQNQVPNIANTMSQTNISLMQQTGQMMQVQDLEQSLCNPSAERCMPLKDVITEWLQYLNDRTKKSYDDDEYFSPTTLQSYNRYIWGFIFPYLEKNPQYDNIYNFTEKNVDEIFTMTNSKETQRIMLVSLRLVFEYAKSKSYIEQNPIANKRQKKSNKKKKIPTENDVDYEFIEEDERASWINCMIKDINCINVERTDAALAFLFTLLHGMRPEETCGVKWSHLNFDENDFYVQNAYKTDPVFDETTMKRTGWVNQDGPLKTPESYRHLTIDLLIKSLLLEHKKQQKAEFKSKGKKWSENEYVFLNSSRTPFTPRVLSKNFARFIKRNNLTHMVLYGLRHSFATHCRNLGMPPEILARLMGHTEYETTQKYYIHISAKQKREELQKIQQKDIQSYLGEENKDFIHLQNKININKKHITDLQEIQAHDMKDYNEIDDKTLNVLKDFILNLQHSVA